MKVPGKALALIVKALSKGEVGLILSPEIREDILEPGEFVGKTLILPVVAGVGDASFLAWMGAYHLQAPPAEGLPGELEGLYMAIMGRLRALRKYPGAERVLESITHELWERTEPVNLAPDRVERILRIAMHLLWFGRVKGDAGPGELSLARRLLDALRNNPIRAVELLPNRRPHAEVTGSEIYRSSTSRAVQRSRSGKGLTRILAEYTLFTEEPSEVLKRVLEGRPPSPPELHYYHEWDVHSGSYRRNWCRVVEYEALGEGEGEPPEFMPAAQAIEDALSVPSQPKGDADGYLDHGRLVEVLGEWSPDPRDYRVRLESLMARELGFILLLDLSSSMSGKEGWLRKVAGTLILALAWLGIPFSVLGFRSAGRDWVEVLKMGDNRDPRRALRRLWGAKTAMYTRMGAAIRHASRLASELGAGWRILLLSDLNPWGLGLYRNREYSVADAAKAVEESFSRGVPVGALAPTGSCRDWLPCSEAGDLPTALEVLLS